VSVPGVDGAAPSEQTRAVDDEDEDQSMEQVLERLLEQFPSVPLEQIVELVNEEIDFYDGEIPNDEDVPDEVEASARERLEAMTAARPDSPDDDS